MRGRPRRRRHENKRTSAFSPARIDDLARCTWPTRRGRERVSMRGDARAARRQAAPPLSRRRPGSCWAELIEMGDQVERRGAWT